MLQAIGHILPIAAALAVSSVPITAMVLILLSPNRRRSALPFMLGWVIGLALAVTLCALGAELVPASRAARRPDTVIGVLEILIGAGLLIVAFLTWRRGRRVARSAANSSATSSTTPSLPKWLAEVGSLGGWAAFGLALILNFRPKGLLLAMAAGLSLRAETLDVGESAIVILVYTAIAASTVVVPIIATMIAPDRMTPRLTETQDWLVRNGSAVGSIVLAVIATVVIGSGIARL